MDWGMAASEVRRGRFVPRGFWFGETRGYPSGDFRGMTGGMADKKNLGQGRNSRQEDYEFLHLSPYRAEDRSAAGGHRIDGKP
jgi:hypothetical protein